MTVVVFKNKGEIDPRAFTSFGISAKDTDNPIGYFGTGLKYAVAVLLREGCGITVLSGERRMEFSAEPDTFRGKEFQFIHMTIDGGEPRELGFTTELGKNWELWAAYRELACNCMDEGGEAFVLNSGDILAMPSETLVIVSGSKFLEVHAARHTILLQSQALLRSRQVEVELHPLSQENSNAVFYRGVRVHVSHKPCLYTYNVLGGVSLTEDRTLASEFALREVLDRAYLQLEDERVLEKVLLADSNHYEQDLDCHGWSTQPSEAFLRVVGRLVADKFTSINATAVRVWKEKTSSGMNPTPVELTRVQESAISKATHFCESIGFPVRQYKLTICSRWALARWAWRTRGRYLLRSACCTKASSNWHPR